MSGWIIPVAIAACAVASAAQGVQAVEETPDAMAASAALKERFTGSERFLADDG